MPSFPTLGSRIKFAASLATVTAPLILCGYAIAQIGGEPVNNGCFEDEAMIRFFDRDTCYPYDNLPIELQAYIAPAHLRTATPGGR